MKLQEYFKDAKVYIWEETFAIIKAKKADPNAFANIIDRDEITVIIDQSIYDKESAIDIEKDWRVVTLDVVFPMDVVGVTARMSNAFAQAEIAIMSIAAFSRDHFLIKDDNIERAAEVMERIGITVERTD